MTSLAIPGTDLGRFLMYNSPPFALLHRPSSFFSDQLEILFGEVSEVHHLADLPLPAEPSQDGPHHELLAVVPYRQIAERGFRCHDDGTPIVVLTVTAQHHTSVSDALHQLPTTPIPLTDAEFDVSDEDYAASVRHVLDDEIGQGAGSNFVLKRAFTATITDYSLQSAMALFRRLLAHESSAYWTFLVHTGSRVFVGASPERHVSLTGNTVVMNPISGTYRYGQGGPRMSEVLSFLADQKEADELYMVVDEELKMMTSICDSGVRVVGPYLREMSQLAHTEYFLKGSSSLDPREILRGTMLAPTVTGSPLENACRVLARHESSPRGYYSGALALVSRDYNSQRTLDSSIFIRTADIDCSGGLNIGVGATLVRHSDPQAEVAETWAKAASLLTAMGVGAPRPQSGGQVIDRNQEAHPDRHPLSEHPQVRAALEARNTSLAKFWLGQVALRHSTDSSLSGREALVVDAEDTFTNMLAEELRAIGLTVTVQRHDQACARVDLDYFDLVVIGPGPGDPLSDSDPRIKALREVTSRLLKSKVPFIAECLGHQILAALLGLHVAQRATPNQGLQCEIDFLGTPQYVGFYNTFSAWCKQARFESPLGKSVEVSRNPQTDEVHTLRGDRFCSVQFHPESLLTQHGIDILRLLVTSALAGSRTMPNHPPLARSGGAPSATSRRPA